MLSCRPRFRVRRASEIDALQTSNPRAHYSSIDEMIRINQVVRLNVVVGGTNNRDDKSPVESWGTEMVAVVSTHPLGADKRQAGLPLPGLSLVAQRRREFNLNFGFDVNLGESSISINITYEFGNSIAQLSI